MKPASRHRQLHQSRGFTLIEVIVSVVIIASAFVPLMVSLGGAADRVLDTVNRRKLRYLMQIQVSDVAMQEIRPNAEESRYEEGQTGTFEWASSSDDPDEYAGFEFTLEKYQDVIIVGGSDEETLLRAGFERDQSGQMGGRPVTHDLSRPGEEGKEPEEPEGVMKRLVVLAVRHIGETADSDTEFRIMTYLPVPDEDEIAGGGANGAGPGGAVPGGTPENLPGGANGGKGGASGPPPPNGGLPIPGGKR